jgi:hypothetical protein
MWQRIRDKVIPNLLFAGSLLLAAVLGILVLTAHWLLAYEPDNRLLGLFAHDSTVRRTAVASSVGLAVTAFVFFRPGVLRLKKSKTRRPPPSTLAGA